MDINYIEFGKLLCNDLIYLRIFVFFCFFFGIICFKVQVRSYVVIPIPITLSLSFECSTAAIQGATLVIRSNMGFNVSLKDNNSLSNSIQTILF